MRAISGTYPYTLCWCTILCTLFQHSDAYTLHDLLILVGLTVTHGASAALSASLRPRYRTVFVASYVPFCILLICLVVVYGAFANTGGVLGPDNIRALAQTNVQEAFAYTCRLFTPTSGLELALFAAALVTSFPRRGAASTLPHAMALVLLLGAGLTLAYSGTLPRLEAVRRTVAEYQSETRRFRALLAQRKARPVLGATSTFNGTAVVVIGESTSRRHMSLYGYFRETTPLLDKASARFVTFTDVVSAHSHTVPSLAAALTSSGTSSVRTLFSAESTDIISLARGAGFRTSWLSNQNEYGLWDNPVTLLAKSADTSVFVSSEVGRTLTRSHFDQELLPRLRAILNEGGSRKLIVVHLFSDHWPYCTNHPKAFRHFSERLGQNFFGNTNEPGDYNCYDDGIRSIDSFLSQAMNVADGVAEPVVFVYFSDHGEAALLGTAHEGTMHSSYQIEIPLLLWSNAAYSKTHSALFKTAYENVDRPYSTANMYHSLAELLEIQHGSVDTHRSILSKELIDTPRTALDGRVQYDVWSSANDYRENSSINLRHLGGLARQVWASDLHTLGALVEAEALFQGVVADVDLIDNGQCFRVHGTANSEISPALRDMFDISARRPKMRFWINWRNADPTRIHVALNCLEKLDAAFKIRNRMVIGIDSDVPVLVARSLAEVGFAPSYRLVAGASIASDTPSARARHARDICDEISAGYYRSLVFPWSEHEFVRQYLESCTKEQHVALFTDDDTLSVADEAAGERIRATLVQWPSVELAVTFPSQFRLD